MRGKSITFLVCMLMLVGTLLPLSAASCQQTSNRSSESQKESISWTTRFGFIIGYFESATWEGDRCMLIASSRTAPFHMLTFFVPFRHQQLKLGEQIQLVNPKACLILKNFVIGFSKIFLPKATISMHVVSQNDPANTVTWVVDSIDGDSIWGCNMHTVLYNQSGQKYVGEWTSGPYKNEYVSVGDHFTVTPKTDGYYRMELLDDVTGHVLYSSPLIKF